MYVRQKVLSYFRSANVDELLRWDLNLYIVTIKPVLSIKK